MKRSGFVMMMAAALTFAGAVSAQQCTLEVSTPKPVLLAGEKQTTYIKIGVTGFAKNSDSARQPLNVAIVLDRSGSMSGEKIVRAKEAAAAAVEMMRPDDIVSIIAYDTEVEVMVPATKCGDAKEILAKIAKIAASGTTALYAGTQRGGEEVKKFLDREKINRVILLSDGMANVGPSTPEELGRLGQELGGGGISVTTLGLGEGYNEDLMLKLSQRSDGNHVFITKASHMAEVFAEEFKIASQVVAQEVSCKLVCDEGIRPVRVLNRDADITGQNVVFGWNQIYAHHQRYVLVEVEVPAGKKGESRKLATANVTYANMATNATDEISTSVSVKFSDSASEVEKSLDKKVMEETAVQIANLENIRATLLRDQGDVAGAKRVLERNQYFLEKTAGELGGSMILSEELSKNSTQADVLDDDANWNSNRKMMRANQAAPASQQLSIPVR